MIRSQVSETGLQADVEAAGDMTYQVTLSYALDRPAVH
jgi:hypothetical protein